MAEQPWGVWGQLTVNLLAVAFFISVWAHLQFWFSRRLRPIRHAAFGVAMGLGAVASMLQAFRLEAGVIFDFRFPLIAVAGFSGGPLGASVAALFAGAYRVYVGGPGMPAGLMGIGLMACIGTAGYLLFGRTPRTWHVGTLALAVGAGSTLSFLALPPDLLASVASSVMAPVVALGIVATFMAGLTILHTKRIAAERLLLRAAIAQAPDYQYVKDTRSQFVAVNTQVARHNGFERTDDLVGMTDADIAEGDRARALLQQEASIMQSGEALIEHEERLGEGHGEKWFLTSKVPLRDEEGEIIGIAGVTRDITQRRKMEQDLVDSRNLLSFAMSEMADGLAMFDRDGHLIYCNERYRSTVRRQD